MTHSHAGFDARTGIGLRAPHIAELLRTRPLIGWVEVHSENWMTDEGPVAERLQDVRDQYPVSLHGVGLSLGSADGLDRRHLGKLKTLVERCQPILVSEHLSWSRVSAYHSNDLLPLPLNRDAIDVLVRHIDQVQQFLGRRVLVENVSTYCTFANDTMPEWAFVREVVERADCGLLLDLNNIYVNAHNHGFATADYLSAMPWQRVEEIHLAGYEEEDGVLIDTHGRAVQAPVWGMYAEALISLPSTARVLIEWDSALPSLPCLLDEARKADNVLAEVRDAAA